MKINQQTVGSQTVNSLSFESELVKYMSTENDICDYFLAGSMWGKVDKKITLNCHEM